MLAESHSGNIMRHDEMTFEERCFAMKRVVGLHVVHV